MITINSVSDSKFLNPEKTVIQALVNNEVLITIEKDNDVYNLYDRFISGEFGDIDENLINFNLNEELQKENIIISRLQAKAILFQYGLLEAVESLIAEQSEIIQLVWKEASQFEYLSPTIQALKGNITLPDGSEISEEHWKQMFIEAKNIQF
jgi:hypothetical protein